MQVEPHYKIMEDEQASDGPALKLILKGEGELGSVVPNVGTLVLDNAARLNDAPAFAERVQGRYVTYSWKRLADEMELMASCLDQMRQQRGTQWRGRIAFVAMNSYARHVTDLAVMACGFISVPVFAGYPAELLSRLLQFSDLDAVVTDQPDKILALDPSMWPPVLILLAEPREVSALRLYQQQGGKIWRFEDVTTIALAKTERDLRRRAMRAVAPQQVCQIMFTSGTSGFPKGVQLTHHNLMSQQKALALRWQPEDGLRLLCYLPWHHSFGGLFERFFAVYFGACLALDDSCGKDVDRLLENFAEIKPHVFFSVPKIYQEIVARVQANAEIEKSFFHPQLKFVFTAAAPLPLSCSAVFRDHGVMVVEGWGLTETSPCCTLTAFSHERTPGIVGLPIPGVEIGWAADGELLVRGPNVMQGYFRSPEATAKVFSKDGWFHTGDVGEIGAEGVRIVSRKERMFKLSNGEKVFPAQLEERIHTRCKFVKYAYVFGSGQRTPHLLVFPNLQALEGCASGATCTDSACAQPNSSEQLANCLSRCLSDINARQAAGFEAIKKAVVVGRELSIENNELTPSFKLIPKRVEERFIDCIEAMERESYDALPSDTFVLHLE